MKIMKKHMMSFLVVCISLAGILPATVFAQNFSQLLNNDNTVIASEVSEKINTSNNNKKITTYQFDGGYSRYLEIYDENNQGGFRIDSGIQLYKLRLDFGKRQYICAFRIQEGINADEQLSDYKHKFKGLENNVLSNEQVIEQYFDELLQEDVLSFYLCTDADRPAVYADMSPYTSSNIVELNVPVE